MLKGVHDERSENGEEKANTPISRENGGAGARSRARRRCPSLPPTWIDARQPMPVALWHPWSEDSFEADWTRSSQVEVEGVGRVWVSFCFEDVLPGFVLSAILHKPDQIVSMANNWWSTEDGSQAQARSIESASMPSS